MYSLLYYTMKGGGAAGSQGCFERGTSAFEGVARRRQPAAATPVRRCHFGPRPLWWTSASAPHDNSNDTNNNNDNTND